MFIIYRTEMKKRSSKNCCLPFCKSKVKEPPKAIQEHNEVPALRSPSNKDLVARTTAMTPQANKEESYFPSKQRRRLEDYLDLKKSEEEYQSFILRMVIMIIIKNPVFLSKIHQKAKRQWN